MKRKVAMTWMLVLSAVLILSILAGGGGCSEADRARVHATNVVVLSEANFQSEVIAASKPVLVDFWAPWCGPCRTIGPIVNELATDFEGRATVAKVNVDDAPALAQRFGIQGIPTLLIFHNGRVADQVTGVVPKSELTAKLDRVIAEAAKQTGKSAAISTNR